jgi:hypothetical protein
MVWLCASNENTNGLLHRATTHLIGINSLLHGAARYSILRQVFETNVFSYWAYRW